MRLLIQHQSRYRYPRPAALGPHIVRLRPASHTRARVETYGLHIEQEHFLRWQQDPFGNHVARVTFPTEPRIERFDVLVELAVEIKPVNPFDFFLEKRFETLPFEYPSELRAELAPFLDLKNAAYLGGGRLAAFLDAMPRAKTTIDTIVGVNRYVARSVNYVIREEAGIWHPEETLEKGRGSCRDSAVLLVAALRSLGLAARFVSGYLIQLTDEGMIPNEPKGVSRDVVDLHAWAEVFLPGAGWIGLDATSGLLCGEGHIPLACTATPALASPIDGTSDTAAEEVAFEIRVGRLGHEPRPTRPYEEATWGAIVEMGRKADAVLGEQKLRLTMGGEPTFTSREHMDAPEWNGEALGPTKIAHGKRLVNELRERLNAGAVTLLRTGKWYPGESLPRWALDLIGKRDGEVVWRNDVSGLLTNAGVEHARTFAKALAERLNLAGYVVPAYEDPWRFLQEEASLPVDVDPFAADLTDAEERRRLARVLDRGLALEAGFALPLTRVGRQWQSDVWKLRRQRLYLVPGDSPMGLRLPLSALGHGAPVPPPCAEEPWGPHDPRVDADEAAQLRLRAAAPTGPVPGVRTALCVEARGGELFVFLPPMWTADDFFDLVAAVDATREETGFEVTLEGYAAPKAEHVYRLTVTPDPGVLEVNISPTETTEEYTALMGTVFEAALAAGLQCEKYLIDGRLAGSGGGHHLTFGGPTPLSSPFVTRPDLLASVLTFFQHHPAMSYLFAGLFVGPTSQAPRIDEARHESLYELEIALKRAHARGEPPAPWLTDLLFRNLLVDVTGNTHRTEISIDKLFDPLSQTGRLGIVELRAFEMPPHPDMAVTQMLLARALLASFAREPYEAPLVRWGMRLHDEFLLPWFLARDIADVQRYLGERGFEVPFEAFQPFVDLRCPLVGRLQAGDVTVEVRNAIEPWHVLGEETGATGTSRYVDSSLERVEVRAMGLVEGRHVVVVNGVVLPMHATAQLGTAVAGVRFRAWCPPHSLQPHLGVHHPLRIDVVDLWAKRSLGACGYHVWHPEGRAFDAPPLTRFEASARRSQRFTHESPTPWPVAMKRVGVADESRVTLDLRRFDVDHAEPDFTRWAEE